MWLSLDCRLYIKAKLALKIIKRNSYSHANISDFDMKERKKTENECTLNAIVKEKKCFLLIKIYICCSCWWFTFSLKSILLTIQNKGEDKNQAKTINKVRIDSVMDDMNRLMRDCLKAIFFSFAFFYLFCFILLSYFRFALFHFGFHCLLFFRPT